MLRTPLCDRFGIEVPIILAPMGTCTSAELAAAVSNAGGLGGIGSFSRTTAIRTLLARDGLPYCSEREAAATVVRPGGQHLVDLDAPGLEADGARRRVEVPDPGPTEPGQPHGVVPPGLQVRPPSPGGSARSAPAVPSEWRTSKPCCCIAAMTEPSSCSSPSGKTKRLMNVRFDHGAAGSVTGQPSVPRAGRQMPWLSSRPCGTSSSRRWLKYSPRRLRPTCSNMPMELMASNGPSSTSR